MSLSNQRRASSARCARDASALRALGLKQRVLAGRLRSVSQGGRWGGSHFFEHGIKISIIEKARKRELGIFLFSTVYAQQRLSRSGSAGAGPIYG